MVQCYECGTVYPETMRCCPNCGSEAKIQLAPNSEFEEPKNPYVQPYRPYGMPMIPGSTLKGLARAQAKRGALAAEALGVLFGRQTEQPEAQARRWQGVELRDGCGGLIQGQWQLIVHRCLAKARADGFGARPAGPSTRHRPHHSRRWSARSGRSARRSAWPAVAAGRNG